MEFAVRRLVPVPPEIERLSLLEQVRAQFSDRFDPSRESKPCPWSLVFVFFVEQESSCGPSFPPHGRPRGPSSRSPPSQVRTVRALTSRSRSDSTSVLSLARKRSSPVSGGAGMRGSFGRERSRSSGFVIGCES